MRRCGAGAGALALAAAGFNSKSSVKVAAAAAEEKNAHLIKTRRKKHALRSVPSAPKGFLIERVCARACAWLRCSASKDATQQLANPLPSARRGERLWPRVSSTALETRASCCATNVDARSAPSKATLLAKRAYLIGDRPVRPVLVPLHYNDAPP